MWLCGAAPFDEAPVCPSQWLTYMRQHPACFRSAVMKAARLPTMIHPSRRLAPRRAQEALKQWSCEVCDTSCCSRQACAVHMYRKHGQRSECACRLVTTFCPICMIQFWTRARALEHLGKSSCCSATLLLFFEPASSQDLDEINHLERLRARKAKASGRKAHWAEKPCVRLVGPLPVALTDRAIAGTAGTLGIGRKLHII